MILDKRSAVVLLIALSLGCAQHAENPTSKQLRVIATITPIASLVQSVAGDRARVSALVPAGVSPETYDPRPSDMISVSEADLLVENGAGLETWLQKLVHGASKPQLRVVTLAGTAVRNPHLWLDPVYAQDYVRKVADALAQADPANAAYYRANAQAEQRSLAQLNHWIKSQIAGVPASRRGAITFHDAWYYFDRRYGIRDVGVVEKVAGSEPSAEDFAHLIETAKANHVSAIFGEPQFSPKLVKQLTESTGIRGTAQLYDDTLGPPQINSYDDMLRYDVNQMVKAMNA